MILGRRVPDAACPRCKGHHAQRLGFQESPRLDGTSVKTGDVWGCLDCRLTFIIDRDGVRAAGGWKPPAPQAPPQANGDPPDAIKRRLADDDLMWNPKGHEGE